MHIYARLKPRAELLRSHLRSQWQARDRFVLPRIERNKGVNASTEQAGHKTAPDEQLRARPLHWQRDRRVKL